MPPARAARSRRRGGAARRHGRHATRIPTRRRVRTNRPRAVAAPVAKKPTGYPIEEALRPITLPQNMAEVSIASALRSSPFADADALRARYGITPQVQLGLTYVFGGIYDDPTTDEKTGKAFHAGKAVGLDVTVCSRTGSASRSACRSTSIRSRCRSGSARR